MNWINGSIIVGNPTTPCSGTGYCELTPGLNTDLTVPVVAMSSGGDDFGVLITNPTMEYLAQLHPNMAEAITNGSFQFEGTALPFYLDPALSSQLWPKQSYNKIGSPGDACSVVRLDGTDGFPAGYKIQFARVGKNYDPHLTGGPGVIQNLSVSVGSWQIGADGWGNLVFTNRRNTVTFGKNGNVSVNRRSVTAGARSMYTVGGMFQRSFTAGDWTVGLFYVSGGGDSETDICFTNSINVIAFPQSFQTLFINGNSADTAAVSTPISDASDGSDQLMGDLLFFENNNGDLIMRKIGTGNTIAFGAFNGLYINGFRCTVSGDRA